MIYIDATALQRMSRGARYRPSLRITKARISVLKFIFVLHYVLPKLIHFGKTKYPRVSRTVKP